MYIYAALGDSITYGENASSVERAFPSLLVSMLNSKGVQAKRIVLARPGWTSADLANAVATDPLPLRSANAVTVWIGGDDLIQTALQLLQGSGSSIEATMRQYERRLGGILRNVRAMGPQNLICCTQYNPFPNSPIAQKSVGALNQAITSTAVKNGCRIARVDQWFAGSEAQLIDGYRSGKIEEVYQGVKAVHPNNRGHAVIAKGLFPFLYANKSRHQSKG